MASGDHYPDFGEVPRKQAPSVEMKNNPAEYGIGGGQYVSRPTEGTPVYIEKPYSFALQHGEGGATIWFGQLLLCLNVIEFQPIKVSGKTINGLVGQGAIGTVHVKTPAQFEEFDYNNRAPFVLGWYGDVYLYWECDDEANVSMCDIRGEDGEPEGQDIAELNEDLDRYTSDGKYYIKLGTVEKDGLVTQLVSSDVTWCITVLRGTGSAAESSSVASSSAMSESGGPKSSAIVPHRLSPTQFAALFVMEAPEVLFFDVQSVRLTGNKTVYNIDPWFVEVCSTASIRVIGPCADKACLIGARVAGGQVIIEVDVIRGDLPKTASFLLCGTRRGFAGVRFALRDLEQFKANEETINGAYPAKDLSNFEKDRK